MDNLNIVFEDNHLIVLIKPQNLLSQGDETGDENLVDLLKEYLKEKYNKKGNVYVGLVHRLDRPTGGLMVFAKTSKCAERLCDQIKNGELEKTYLTALNGEVKQPSGTLVDYLNKNETTNTVEVLSYAKAGAKKAELSYELLETKQNLSLVKVALKTGRSHQIRVQFASRGNSVFGDAKYGTLTSKGHNLALWAYKIRFLHPTTKQPLVFVSFPDCEIAPWKVFSCASDSFKKLAKDI